MCRAISVLFFASLLVPRGDATAQVTHSLVRGDYKRITSLESGLLTILASGGKLGWSVTSIGDLDGDGVTDVAAGAPQSFGTGTVWILFLNNDGTVKSSKEIGSLQGGFSQQLSRNAFFGYSVAWLGDLGANAPTQHALAVGAPLESVLGDSVFLLFLDSTGTVVQDLQLRSEPASWFGTGLAWLGNLGPTAPTARALAVGAMADPDPVVPSCSNTGTVRILFLNEQRGRSTHRPRSAL